ncbi:MAG TPA: universal stress protein [Planctomycetota bacterium]|nr:universal stress protein [Planctomycetota bacterium]
MFERILLPLDGSTLGEAILPRIAHILRREDSELLLLRIAQLEKAAVGRHVSPPALPDPVMDAHAYLAKIEDRFAAQGARVRSIVDVGSPAARILDIARREDVTLIAMATHGHTGLARSVFGSVSERVLRASSVPLLLLRSFQEGGSPAPSEPLTFDRVLVPIADFHLRILEYVREFAIHFGSKVTLVHVSEPGEDRWAQDQARAELRLVQTDLESAGIPTDLRERRGDPAVEILESARDERAGLIAMTTCGLAGSTRWAAGSVTEKVLRSATVPMLVVRNQ